MRKISEKKNFKGRVNTALILKQPRFHVEYFMTCALLVGISEFRLAPYPKMLVSTRDVSNVAKFRAFIIKVNNCVVNSWTTFQSPACCLGQPT